MYNERAIFVLFFHFFLVVLGFVYSCRYVQIHNIDGTLQSRIKTPWLIRTRDKSQLHIAGNAYKYTSLIRTNNLVSWVSAIERFHCISLIDASYTVHTLQ